MSYIISKYNSDSNEFLENIYLHGLVRLESEKLDLKISKKKLNNNMKIADCKLIVINEDTKRACNKIAIKESRKLSLQTVEDLRKILIILIKK